MKRLIFPNGGVFLQADDLRYQAEGYTDAINAILHRFTVSENGNCILYGVEPTFNANGSVTWSEGYFTVSYELRYFAGYIDLDPSTSTLGFVSENIPDLLGLELLADNTQGDTYEMRHVIMVDVSTNPPNQIFDAQRIEDLMLKVLCDIKISGAVQSANLTNGWLGVLNLQPKYSKRLKQVTLEGAIVDGTIDVNNYTKAFTLPVGFRPLVGQLRMLPTSIGQFVYCQIQNNGDVLIKDVNNIGNSNAIYLDSFTYESAI